MPAHCTPFTLPSNGVLSFASAAITLTTNVVFQPQCTATANESVSTIDKSLRDPFYASTTPQTYVVAATTVIAWVLVVMLIITPRTSFIGNPAAQPTFGNGRGIIGGATGGGTNLIGVGSRPWLQKVAALTVAISLTIATADTFKVAAQQYETGYMNASSLRDEVLGSVEVRVTRVISDVFLWLAQVQTLIRLFPRHKEKVLIKWIGFALIICDSIFSCLNSFLIHNSRPGHFVEAIPALSYLFELALGLLYAAWVIYYSLTKRRYAFFHAKMRSICLIALLSLIAVLTPVVFFVTDVSNQDVAGWGDYFRWVGAAAASVVVWEWVERIEALERDEKKDGILGREIFDGDEMLDVSPSEEAVFTGGRRATRRLRQGLGEDDNDDRGDQSSALENGLSGMAQRFKRRAPQKMIRHFPLGRAHSSTKTSGGASDPPNERDSNSRGIAFGRLPKPNDHPPVTAAVLGQPTLPQPVASPISRADTTSAASTVYVVRHDTGADTPQPVRRRLERNANGNNPQTQAGWEADRRTSKASDPEKVYFEDAETDETPNVDRTHMTWLNVANPFKRKRTSPPVEVQRAAIGTLPARSQPIPQPTGGRHNFSKWDVKNRLGVLAAETGERIRERSAAHRRPEVESPVVIVPAQPRGSGRTWSPDQQRHVAATPWSTPSYRRPVNPAPSPRPATERQDTNITIIEAPPRGQPGHTPPRADDISPIAGRTVEAPAPSPGARRSPLRNTSPADGGGSNGSFRDGGNG